MSRGLSKQQKRILAVLETKEWAEGTPKWDKDRGYFTTQEIVIELDFEFGSWLEAVRSNPWTSNRKEHIDYPKFDKIRLSIYRALQSLEKRGLIVSFRYQNDRCWAVLERLKERSWGNKVYHEKDWVRNEKERREAHNWGWRWGAFIRTLPKMLHIKYMCRVADKQDMESIKKLWKKYKNARFNVSKV